MYPENISQYTVLYMFLNSVKPFIENRTLKKDFEVVTKGFTEFIDFKLLKPSHKIGTRTSFVVPRIMTLIGRFKNSLASVKFEKEFEEENARMIIEGIERVAFCIKHVDVDDQVSVARIAIELEEVWSRLEVR